MRTYILTHSATLEYTYVLQVLNTTQSIETWVAPFPNSAIVISRLTVIELSAVLHSHFGEAWFILTEATKDNSNGWLPKEFWDYISEPQSVCSRQLLSRLALPSVPPPPNALPRK